MSPYRPDLVACWLFRVIDGRRLEVLLIRRSPDRMYPGLWQCVTGKLEPGERISDAALREVAEETGLGPAEIEAFFETDIVNWFHEQAVDGLLCEAVFAARIRATATARLSHEHDAFEWLEPETARGRVVWPAYRRAIDHLEWLLAHPEKAAAYRLPDPV
ncbi:MAG TPA: NUDIX domain-containing protein [Candidatus Acidoferrales bacterium]|nr:NUDIX domain-containing protein [Candidatus Acidoferrales bacterium]